jgi:hypothetical protein
LALQSCISMCCVNFNLSSRFTPRYFTQFLYGMSSPLFALSFSWKFLKRSLSVEPISLDLGLKSIVSHLFVLIFNFHV